MATQIICTVFLLVFFHTTLGVRPSPGCSESRSKPSNAHKAYTETIYFTYEDKLLGPVDRNYIIQVPQWSDDTTPLMMVLDLHGWTGSASYQVHGSGWGKTGSNEGFVVVWPDGMGDSPNVMGSWNCSKTIGPMGPTCDTDREAWGQSQECYYSCPLCDEKNSCDWSTCYDDIGFMEYVIQDVSEKWCIDMDQLHLSGISNGGMYAYFVAAMATDALGLASINPVGASSLIGFGTPPDVEINFSIVDFHGTDDDTIPHDVTSEHSFGTGPHDTVISWDAYYYEQKKNLLANWARQMQCDEEHVYETPYDGQSDLRCFERNCKNGKAILRCLGDYGHDYPLPHHPTIGAEIASEFMRNHPRS